MSHTKFEGPSIIVKKPSSPAHVYGNVAVSQNPKNSAVDIDGVEDAANFNVLKSPDAIEESGDSVPPVWPLFSRESIGNTFHILANSGRKVVIEQEPWKLVVTYGKTPTYELFNTEDDPQNENDLSVRLEQITFRLRGLLEQKEGLEYQAEMHGWAGK